MRMLMWVSLYFLTALLSIPVAMMAWPFLRVVKVLRRVADWAEIGYLLAKTEYQIRRRP